MSLQHEIGYRNLEQEKVDYQEWVASDPELQLFEQNVFVSVHQALQVIKRKGKRNMPPGVHSYDIPTNLTLSSDMDEDEKLNVINASHRIIQGVLNGMSTKGELTKGFYSPELYKWESNTGPVSSQITKIGNVLTIAENIYVGEDGMPLQLRPQIWFGRSNDINAFLTNHPQEALHGRRK